MLLMPINRKKYQLYEISFKKKDWKASLHLIKLISWSIRSKVFYQK